jgi:hypothetical protein
MVLAAPVKADAGSEDELREEEVFMHDTPILLEDRPARVKIG